MFLVMVTGRSPCHLACWDMDMGTEWAAGQSSQPWPSNLVQSWTRQGICLSSEQEESISYPVHHKIIGTTISRWFDCLLQLPVSKSYCNSFHIYHYAQSYFKVMIPIKSLVYCVNKIKNIFIILSEFIYEFYLKGIDSSHLLVHSQNVLSSHRGTLARSQELSPISPIWVEEPRHLIHHHCLPGCTLTGIWNGEASQTMI